MTDAPTAADCLAAITAKDPTGGLRILDCNHDFGKLQVIVCPDGPGAPARPSRWLLISAWDPVCWNCKKPGGVVFAHFIECCPFCMAHRNDAHIPLRNS